MFRDPLLIHTGSIPNEFRNQESSHIAAFECFHITDPPLIY